MPWSHAALLVLGYVALDWASFIHAMHGLNITPWSPAPALGMVFVMRFGARAGLHMLVGILLADALLRELPEDFLLRLLLALTVAAGYTVAGLVMRGRMTLETMFANHADLLWWMAIVVVGSAVVSLAYVSILAGFGVVPAEAFPSALARYWIGDGIGVVVTMPLLAMLMSEQGRMLLKSNARRWEAWAYSVATIGAVALCIGLGAESDFKYFYVVFLPIAWAALAQGQTGAVIAAALAQIAIIGVVQLRGFSAVTVFEIQAVTVVLVLLGFLVGVVIDEQRRTSGELRHSLRLAAAGEMAGALAHELNQPLTAMSAYAAACEDLIEQNARGEQLLDMVRRMVAESQRASGVVARLRDFFRTGDTRLEPLASGEVIEAAAKSFAARAERSRVKLDVRADADAVLLADRLQIEVVIRNLMANAFDAVETMPDGSRWVSLALGAAGPGRIEISVEDSGPGLAAEAIGRAFEPFRSNKSSGLGLGLAISRAIVEAHGGTLWAEGGAHGIFRMVLPTERGASDGAR